MYRIWLFTGALAGLLGVALSALAAHALPGRLLPGELTAFREALALQGWHAPVLLACGIWTMRGRNRLVHFGAALLTLGLILFCGTVYAHALSLPRVPPAAPVGGVVMMLGWIVLLVAALRG